jgi:AcrR family transcriptional regulator
MALSRREHLVKTALQLFCEHGFRATGIDTVLAESGVAKKTLYNHFKSKDELIVAALAQRDAQFLEGMHEAIGKFLLGRSADKHMAKVLAYFDALEEWICSDRFYGCTFINASAEYPSLEDPVHVACAEHKQVVINLVQELLVDFPVADSTELAQQLAMLGEGAIVLAHTAGDTQAVASARDAAQRLMKSYL